ncbi:MAG: histidine phosphatase family protein [SAR202 cluster bacterium]|nr:histidine phosphatase family protein [SAR202 cluster bacterium]MDP7225871.1 histidine phosphatase family protein [SAR202 cluster bacterium]MDP7532839.1 histidine phosphatase family protein [SAR202 cluster bacterium]
MDRFDQSIATIIDSETDSDIVVVAHGAVITLFLARHAGVDPMDVWRSLGLPSYAVLALPDYALLDIVTDIT